MPAYDWTPHPDAWFHHVHNAWIYQLVPALNGGLLPDGFFAAGEQKLSGGEPDAFTYELDVGRADDAPRGGGVRTLDAPPRASFVVAGAGDYSLKEDRVSVRTGEDETLVAVVELVSRGNKSSRRRLRQFVEKTTGFLSAGVHVTMVDLHRSGPLDPGGMHDAVWDDLYAAPGGADVGAGRLAAAYHATDPVTAYVEPVVLGRPLPGVPLFLGEREYVELPLEETFAAAVDTLPANRRAAVVDA